MRADARICEIARLGDAEHPSDLGALQPLHVDERDHLTLALRERGRSRRGRPRLLPREQRPVGVAGARCGTDRLADLATELVAGGRVQRHDVSAVELARALAELAHLDVQIGGELVLARQAARLRRATCPGCARSSGERLREERETRSWRRSSSTIEPETRVQAYCSNDAPRAGSKRSEPPRSARPGLRRRDRRGRSGEGALAPSARRDT